MLLSKPILAVLLGLLTAIAGRLVRDEFLLHSLEKNTRTQAEYITRLQRDADAFQKAMDAHTKTHPTGWGNSAKTITEW